METFAARHRDGADLIDVREPMEYVGGHVPGATLVPMSRISSHVGSIPRGRPVYVICQTGNRSLAVADFLVRQGVDAWSVAGGTERWAAAGRPVVSGRSQR
jgi:rhodanese-related sulfurtransferase